MKEVVVPQQGILSQYIYILFVGMAQSNETLLILRRNSAIWSTPTVTYGSDHVHASGCQNYSSARLGRK